MITSLRVENFRGFESLSVDGLGRINLLVGANNSGKTSILEAIELLLAHGDPRSIWTALNRRGERLHEDEDRRSSTELDLCRLFHGHDLNQGQSFLISAREGFDEQTLTARVSELDEDEWNQAMISPVEQQLELSSLGLELFWRGNGDPERIALPITERGGLSPDFMRKRPSRKEDTRHPVSFVSTSSLSSDEAVSLLSRVVLNPEEELLLRALRIIEPDIDRIAPVAISPRYSSYSNYTKGGVVVKTNTFDKRVPIGTMGDGIWRLLSLSLSLIRAENGVLLIDEIDTGLHYSVMEKMWRLIDETAFRLNVQVFATTHSSDCWRSLSAISRQNSHDNGRNVSIQRIERGRPNSVPFSYNEIVIASERGFEIR